MFSTKTIQKKLPLMFLAFAIVICGVLGTYAQFAMKREAQEEIHNALETFAQSKTDMLRNWFNRVRTT